MNFFDDDFGLGATPSYNRKQSASSIAYIFYKIEKATTMLTMLQKNQLRKMIMMIFWMIC